MALPEAIAGAIAQPAPTVQRSVLVLIGVCIAAYLLDGVVYSILGPMAPLIARELHLGKLDLGPVFSANLVGQCFGLVLIPLAGRRFGHRRLIGWSLIGFGIAQALTGLATGRDSLLVLRFVTGVFLGGVLPSCLAIVTQGTPVHRRGVAIMLLFTGFGSGHVVAGFLAGVFGGPGEWRWAMALVGVFCLLCAAAALALLDESLWATSGAERIGREPRPAAWNIVGPTLLSGTLLLWLMFISALIINYCVNSWLPTLLVDVGRSKSFAAFSASVFSAGGTIGTIGVGPLIDRLRPVRTMVLFFSVSAVLMLVIGQVMSSLDDGAFLVLLALAGFFALGAYGGINVVLAAYYPPSLQAIGTGWTKTVGRLGTVIAPVLIGLALAGGMSQATVMSLFAVPALAAAGALLAIARVQRGARSIA